MRAALTAFGGVTPTASDAASYDAFRRYLNAAVTYFSLNEATIWVLGQRATKPKRHRSGNQLIAAITRYQNSTLPTLSDLDRADRIVRDEKPCETAVTAANRVLSPFPPTAH